MLRPHKLQTISVFLWCFICRGLNGYGSKGRWSKLMGCRPEFKRSNVHLQISLKAMMRQRAGSSHDHACHL